MQTPIMTTNGISNYYQYQRLIQRQPLHNLLETCFDLLLVQWFPSRFHPARSTKKPAMPYCSQYYFGWVRFLVPFARLQHRYITL